MGVYRGSINKYTGDIPQGSRRLSWHGSPSGFPIIDAPYDLLTAKELSSAQPRLDFHAERFDTSNPDQLARYTSIKDRIANNWFAERQHTVTKINDDGYPIIWLEWCEIYMTLPQQTGIRYEE